MIKQKVQQKEQAKTYARLTHSNLDAYIERVYGNQQIKEYRQLADFRPLLQKNFGGTQDGDCTLCSITAVGSYKDKYVIDNETTYNQVVEVANKYFYSPNKFGTIPIFIKKIIDEVFYVKSHAKYLKNVGFNWQTIKTQIKNRNPMVLSITNDGRNYYQAHSITIIGYKEYTNAKFLMVYDNWYESIGYVDYNLLGTSCCINYF